jgi:hypothetical protein
MRAADIDVAFAPRHSERACTEVLDAECVILDEAANRLHHLNASATIAWTCFDGHSSVAEIAADLATAFGTDPAGVEADVLALARDLGAQGLLAGVEPDPERGPDARSGRGSAG